MSIDKLKKCGIAYEKGILFFGGDEELYSKYLEEFAGEELLTQASGYLSAGDVKAAFTAIHKLKALIEYIDIPSVDPMIHAITETLRAGKTDGVEDGMQYLKMVFPDIKQGIREYLAEKEE